MAGHPFQVDWADPMGPAYAAMFYFLLAITCALAWAAQPRSEKPLDPEARGLQWSFLVPWYACVAGDWLQGPYVYALYDAYGFDRLAISQLFVAGFAASMVFGTCAGSLADRAGRKRSCQAYCVLYAASCATKHFASYWVLMAGRVVGGVATSLLFSCFESWLVSEARERRGLSDRHGLGHIFALMWFGNSMVAIFAGVLGDVAVGAASMRRVAGSTLHFGGYCSAFDLAILMLLAGLGLVSCLWEENYGSVAEGTQCDLVAQVRTGVQSICRSEQLVVIMVMVACFEGSMYTFVFHWTPALSNAYSTPAFGMVFSSFMMAYMCGSSIFDLLSSRGVTATQLIQGAFSFGALGFLISGVGLIQRLGFARLVQVYLGFLIFEFCCGLYFPSSSTIKGELVPEGVRSTVYNLYRVPMNAIVLVMLLSDIPMTAVFSICFLLLVAAGVSTASLRAPATQSLKGAAEQEYGAVDEGRVKREADA
jgi:MFS family permease